MSNGLAIFGEQVKSLRYARDRLNGNCLTRPWWDIPDGAPTLEGTKAMDQDTENAIAVIEKQMAEQAEKFADLEKKLNELSEKVGTTIRWADRVMEAFEQGMEE